MPVTAEQRSVRLSPCAPRILRANVAPAYLGMCRTEFNKAVRPYVREFRIGVQGIGFDREELDAWALRSMRSSSDVSNTSSSRMPIRSMAAVRPSWKSALRLTARIWPSGATAALPPPLGR